jgi:hypothetical protein
MSAIFVVCISQFLALHSRASSEALRHGAMADEFKSRTSDDHSKVIIKLASSSLIN